MPRDVERTLGCASTAKRAGELSRLDAGLRRRSACKVPRQLSQPDTYKALGRYSFNSCSRSTHAALSPISLKNTWSRLSPCSCIPPPACALLYSKLAIKALAAGAVQSSWPRTRWRGRPWRSMVKVVGNTLTAH